MNSAGKRCGQPVTLPPVSVNGGLYRQTLINKIKFSNNGRAIVNIGDIEWINENIIRIYYYIGYVKGRKYFWEISINGNIDFQNIDQNDSQELYNLGLIYYEGKVIIENSNKGIELIKKSSEMGYNHAKNWIVKNWG